MEKVIVTIEDVITDRILNNEDVYQDNRIQLEVPDYYNYYNDNEVEKSNKSVKEPRRVIEIQL
tara:strand:- start:249 stop:437 length:189 start_codon:yes stop_codon:yes gene_type:complete